MALPTPRRQNTGPRAASKDIRCFRTPSLWSFLPAAWEASAATLPVTSCRSVAPSDTHLCHSNEGKSED